MPIVKELYSICTALMCATWHAGRSVSALHSLRPRYFDLTRLLELYHHANGLFDRDVRVDAVAVVEVYVVDTETLEGFVASLTNIVWIVTHLARAVWCHIIARLGGEEDVVALASPLEPSANRRGMVSRFGTGGCCQTPERHRLNEDKGAAYSN
jgi:hypothetical protein